VVSGIGDVQEQQCCLSCPQRWCGFTALSNTTGGAEFSLAASVFKRETGAAATC